MSVANPQNYQANMMLKYMYIGGGGGGVFIQFVSHISIPKRKPKVAYIKVNANKHKTQY